MNVIAWTPAYVPHQLIGETFALLSCAAPGGRPPAGRWWRCACRLMIGAAIGSILGTTCFFGRSRAGPRSRRRQTPCLLGSRATAGQSSRPLPSALPAAVLVLMSSACFAPIAITRIRTSERARGSGNCAGAGIFQKPTLEPRSRPSGCRIYLWGHLSARKQSHCRAHDSWFSLTKKNGATVKPRRFLYFPTKSWKLTPPFPSGAGTWRGALPDPSRS
jgi:hypothetical protein